MKFYTLNVADKDINFRLSSADILEIEKKSGKSIQEYIQNISTTTCVALLKYMRKAEMPGFSEKDALALYDELIDNDYSLQTIYMNVIFPACVTSGILTEDDLAKIKKAVASADNESVPTIVK